MADQLETLKQLQRLDGELYQLRKTQQDKPRELDQVNAQLAAQEAKVRTADEGLKKLQLAQKDREVELQTREGQVKKLQGQLFQVKTNKEYSALQREIDTLKADNSLLEESILRGFDAVDQAGKARQQEQGHLAKAQERTKVERQRIEQEQAVLEDQIGRLERERQGLVPDVPREALTMYERILVIRDGLALVPLLESSCGGCHRRLPPQVVNEVYLKAKLVMCESCSRILYFDEAHSKL
ncbi:MAG: hypothetical protein COV75_05655 [Candidatus Omnitrophica bacterium CG11_big_fil_rev_8_21_14_0_20_63_9]|nr:MAG: hypothetical protein COV75_05655 [Candidatus Omnitrophica bacterium CG11_big_fil_rev_8_21_14_0_20_63_9]